MAERVNDDLLFSKAHVIVQQCNTVTRRSHGLSASIAARFAYANVYARRSGKSANTTDRADRPGTLVLCRPPSVENGEPIVACLMAQMAPGKPAAWCLQYGIRAEDDSIEKREEYFRAALFELETHVRESAGSIKTIAFPHGIGCGLAGGNWTRYETMIDEFARLLPGVIVKICKLK